MKLPNILPYRYQHRLATYLHNRAIAGIRETPPIKILSSNLMFLSMLRHIDVWMYLVAIKPIYSRLGPALITIVDDGSLTDADRSLLREHLGEIRYLEAANIHTGSCPRGGTWERLFAIMDLSIEFYVIQVDADIVALGDLREVEECVHENRAFTLAGNPIAKLEGFAETSARSKEWGSVSSIQPAAEQLLVQVPGAASLNYIWGSSGFTGFPRGRGGHDRLAWFSSCMEELLGQAWHKWGSEQVASNFLVANSEDPVVLPWKKYQCYQEPDFTTGTDLNHFYGTFRFVKGTYAAESRRAIDMLESRG
jgi:hypothetical protein